jgi:hypothetical protein
MIGLPRPPRQATLMAVTIVFAHFVIETRPI